MSDFQSAELLDELCIIAARAGAEILKIFNAGFSVTEKDDSSPVTEADHAAEAIILPALENLFSDIPTVGEEEMSAGKSVDVGDRPFWLVDPLDGTKEFVNRRNEFTVNIALIENGMPVTGVVLAPAQDMRTFSGRGPGTAREWRSGEDPRPISARAIPAEGATVVGSRSHGDTEKMKKLIGEIHVAHQITTGSSIKLCLVANGEADLYPRYGPTREWDIAAGHAVLTAAGGSIAGEDGSPFCYGKADFLNPPFFARGLA